MAEFRRRTGFTLVELLIAAALGVLLSGVAMRVLLGEARRGGALAKRLLLKGLQRRTLDLVKADLDVAATWQVAPDLDVVAAWSCPLAGRQPLLAITPRHGTGPVLYSVGPAPSTIWRGRVLMRCGPAFDLEGRMRPGSNYQNRVLLDAVEAFHITQPDGLPVLKLELEQRLSGDGPVVSSSAFG